MVGVDFGATLFIIRQNEGPSRGRGALELISGKGGVCVISSGNAVPTASTHSIGTWPRSPIWDSSVTV